MADITGTVTLDGVAISGAKITAINITAGVVEDTATTDVNGEYTVVITSGDTAHLIAEYDDGTNQFNVRSNPFIATDDPDPVGTPVHWWPMDEGSGSIVADGYGTNDAEIIDATWRQTTNGHGDFVLDFDGYNDHAAYPTPITPPLTIAVSIYPLSPGDPTGADDDTVIESQFSYGNDMGWLLKIGGGTLRFFSGVNFLNASSTPLAASTWQRVGVSYDSSSGGVRIYLDGAEIGSGSVGGFASGTGGGYIGYQGGTTRPMDGSLDNIVIYDHILSAQEIQTDYDQQPWS